MMDLDFSFEPTPWETFLHTKQAGDSIRAVDILAMLEGEDEEVLEDALMQMETGCFLLDLTGIPRGTASGEAALRLRQEMQLCQEGLKWEALENTDPLRLFLEEVAALPVCGDEESLARRYASGEESCAEMLTNLGLSQVIRLAEEHTGYGVLLLDLIQEGSMGLWHAIRSYRSGAYAQLRDRWIRFYMAKAITLQARNNGIGQKLRRALEDFNQVDQRLLADLGRNPTLEEIAVELHMCVEETQTVQKMLENAQILAKIRKPAKDEEEEQEEDQAVEDTAYFQMRQRIGELLSGLDEASARLLTLRFGLEGGQPMSPEEAGRALGLTPKEVLDKEAAALGILRDTQ